MKTRLLLSGMAVLWAASAHGQTAARLPSATSPRALLNQYCTGCHNDKLKSGNRTLTRLDLARPGQNAELAEKVIRKLRAGMMPPAGLPGRMPLPPKHSSRPSKTPSTRPPLSIPTPEGRRSTG